MRHLLRHRVVQVLLHCIALGLGLQQGRPQRLEPVHQPRVPGDSRACDAREEMEYLLQPHRAGRLMRGRRGAAGLKRCGPASAPDDSRASIAASRASA